ncbi:MAG: archease [Euryarchaeota archaeon]|nr:archease [Euryarchaeota archaeon]
MEKRPFRFLEDVALADVAFEARGRTLSALFRNSARALGETMVDPRRVQGRVERRVELEHMEVERLLYRFLSEVVFLKDSERLLLPRCRARVSGGPPFRLDANLSGEHIDDVRHGPALRNDVKAVTMHLFEVSRGPRGWTARVVLDI